MENFTQDSPFIQERMKVWAERMENAIGGRIWETRPPWEMEVFNAFGQKCALRQTCERITMDHALPRQKGKPGRNGRKNMYPLEWSLNSSKNNAHMFKWFDAHRERLNLDVSRFKVLVEHLAKENGMTAEVYRTYYDREYDEYVDYKGGKVRNVRSH